MQRFFIPPFEGDIAELPEATARQLFSVLRMRGGEEIILLDNQGYEYLAQISKINRKVAQAQIIERRPAPPEPPVKISLYQSLLKKENFEWVLQKGTEIGVSEFIPMTSKRSAYNLVRDTKYSRWERILMEASEQCRRGKIPTLQGVTDFSHALQMAQASELKLIPWEEESQQTLQGILAQNPNLRSVAIFIGPEGGFSPSEVEEAQHAGLIPLTFGPQILRAETAAIYAVSVLDFALNPATSA